MEENKGVTPESPAGNGGEPDNTQLASPPVAEPSEPQKPPKGFVPYQALEEERRLRKEAEEKVQSFEKASAPSGELDEEMYSDEGKALRSDIKALNAKLSEIGRREARREAEAEFPFLKDKKEEFDAFLEDEEVKGLSIKKAARLFAAEQGLLNPEPQRKGLEKPTGGGQTPPEPTMTADEVRDFMKNDWKKYEKLLREGKIK